MSDELKRVSMMLAAAAIREAALQDELAKSQREVEGALEAMNARHKDALRLNAELATILAERDAAVSMGTQLERERDDARESANERDDTLDAERVRCIAAEARIGELAKVLRKLEWFYTMTMTHGPECLVCQGQKGDGGHKPNCELAAALSVTIPREG
jgi:hypothetical protein